MTGPRAYCTEPAHQDGEHTAACMPPAEPGNPELRLLRAIFGLCPDCDKTEPHEGDHPEPVAELECCGVWVPYPEPGKPSLCPGCGSVFEVGEPGQLPEGLAEEIAAMEAATARINRLARYRRLDDGE